MTFQNDKTVREKQEEHFKMLFETFKGTPMAVSSESLNHKKTRYSLLSEIFDTNLDTINVHDVGMGLGAYYDFLLDNFPNKKIIYSGTEILEAYVLECQNKYKESNFFFRDLSENSANDKYDYMIMSGVFHQKRTTTIKDWEKYMQNILINSFEMCEKGMAINFISPFVDFYQQEVYYCNLFKLLTFINDDLSRFFEIKHNYALYEFTIFIYTEDYVRTKYQQLEFQKYFRNKN